MISELLKNKIIIALDQQSHESLDNLCTAIKGEFTWVKVGMELFYSQGPEILEKLYKKGFKIFLDLKLYDIPQTVKNAILALNHLPFELITVHLQGGEHMLKMAAEALGKNTLNAKMLGVSVLTSFDEQTWQKTQTCTTSIAESIKTLIIQDNKSYLYGVVSSGHEVQYIKTNTHLKTVVPGIRWSENKHDQSRVMTPAEAIKMGSDFLVIGREITAAQNIPLAIQSLKDHFYANLYQ